MPPEVFITAGWSASGERIVHEINPVGYETVISYSHQLTNESVRLDATSRADGDMTLNLDERAHETMIAD
jgi:hypothetical protein